MEILLDKCLYDKASEQERLQLKEYIDSSPEAYQQYLAHVDFQLDLKTYIEPGFMESLKKNNTPPTKFISFKKIVLSLAALLVVAGILLLPQNEQSSFILTAGHENLKIMRAGETVGELNELRPGDELLVGDTGPVKLRFSNDKSLVVMERNSRLAVLPGKGKSLSLEVGEISAEVTPQKNPFTITTDDAKITVLGTAFSFSYDKRSSRLRVTQGKVKMSTANGQSKTVTAGQSLDSLELQEWQKVNAAVVAGVWRTSYGEMTIKNKVDNIFIGYYGKGSKYSGRFEAEFKDNVLQGKWNSDRGNSGDMSFAFSKDAATFDGMWNSTPNGRPIVWLGKRVEHKQQSFGGYWQTTYGYTWIQKVKENLYKGTYNGGQSRGSLEGVLKDNILQGSWTHIGGRSGPFKFTLSDDEQSFDGVWGNAIEKMTQNWDGKRYNEQIPAKK
ncbi:MAG: FecR family protein [Lentisphaerales bacterium]|nr:FecR family protein [Lentisphaerales bacterium]